MFTNGLATHQYDELHSYEDGINVLGQSMQLDYGSPKQLERAMETARRLEWLTGYNTAGQRQIRSSTSAAQRWPREASGAGPKIAPTWSSIPRLLLVYFNGTPSTRKMVEEIADGFLAHRRPDANGKMTMHFTVNFHTNEDLPSRAMTPWFILWAAYKWTGDKKYIEPFSDNGADSLRTINADALDILNMRDTWGKQILASKHRIAAPIRATQARPTSSLPGSSPAIQAISIRSTPRRSRPPTIASSSIARAAFGSIASTSTTANCSAHGSAASR